MSELLRTGFALLSTLACFASPFIIICLVVVLVKKNKTPEQPPQKTMTQTVQQNNVLNDYDKDEIDEFYDSATCPYKSKYLLTKNEWYFYKDLKEIADEKNLIILAKIRMADLVEVNTSDKTQWRTYFNKISRKHIDFALAMPDNLKIVLLIELDDNTHNEKQYERDRFIESVYKKTGYKLLRVHNSKNLKEKIETLL